jgi:hypothetical protein
MVVGDYSISCDPELVRAQIEPSMAPIAAKAAELLAPIAAKLAEVLFRPLTPEEILAIVAERRAADAAHIRRQIVPCRRGARFIAPSDASQRGRLSVAPTPLEVIAPLRRHAPPVATPAGPRAAARVTEAIAT